MRISGIIKNDVVNGLGVCVSLFVQGCPHHCKGCFNRETWDFSGGYEKKDLKETIAEAISKNNIIRNFSVLGGEPLCPENRKEVKEIISFIRAIYPNIKIFLWTGYTLSELEKNENNDIKKILSDIDFLIDGPFIQDQKDYTLLLRGSKNQKIYKKEKGDFLLILNPEENIGGLNGRS